MHGWQAAFNLQEKAIEQELQENLAAISGALQILQHRQTELEKGFQAQGERLCGRRRHTDSACKNKQGLAHFQTEPQKWRIWLQPVLPPLLLAENGEGYASLH